MADTPTRVQSFKRSPDSLLDTTFRLSTKYVPPDLVASSRAGVNAGFRIRSLIVADLSAMRQGAAKAGVRIRLVSAYRSYAVQAELLRAEIRRLGRARALLRVARPGHSEHQLGTAIDISVETGAYGWAAKNAWRYGFLVSYPAGKTSSTCYQAEAWHLRWVGRERARTVRASGLVYRVWLWRHVPDSHR